MVEYTNFWVLNQLYSTFQALPSFSTACRVPMTSMPDLLLLSHRPLRFYYFFSVLSSLLFRLHNFYCSIFKFINSLIFPLHLSLQHIPWILLFWLLNFSVLNFLFFLYIFYFFTRLSIFICFNSVWNYSLKYIFVTLLKYIMFLNIIYSKSLSDNFIISVILVSVSIDFFFNQYVIFLVLGMTSNFLWKSSLGAYHVMNPWISFNLPLLADFWYPSCRRRCGCCLIITDGRRSWGPPVGLHWYLSGWRWGRMERACKLPTGRMRK